MSRAGNRNRVKFTVTTHSETESDLDVLNAFIEWTETKHLKNYIKIAEMLNILPADANKLMHRAILPEKINDEVAKRMKEVMWLSTIS